MSKNVSLHARELNTTRNQKIPVSKKPTKTLKTDRTNKKQFFYRYTDRKIPTRLKNREISFFCRLDFSLSGYHFSCR